MNLAENNIPSPHSWESSTLYCQIQTIDSDNYVQNHPVGHFDAVASPVVCVQESTKKKRDYSNESCLFDYYTNNLVFTYIQINSQNE